MTAQQITAVGAILATIFTFVRMCIDLATYRITRRKYLKKHGEKA